MLWAFAVSVDDWNYTGNDKWIGGEEKILASIYQAVRVIAVYLLFSSVLLGILQESPYKPYVRLFTSLLFVLLVVRAFSFLSLDADIGHILEQAVEADGFLEQLEEAEQTGQDRIQEEILQELKEKASIVAKGLGYHLKEVEIELKMELEPEGTGEGQQGCSIDAMEIEIEEEEESAGREALKAALAEYFEIEPEQIVIKTAQRAGGSADGKMDRRSWQGDRFANEEAVKGEAGGEGNGT